MAVILSHFDLPRVALKSPMSLDFVLPYSHAVNSTYNVIYLSDITIFVVVVLLLVAFGNFTTGRTSIEKYHNLQLLFLGIMWTQGVVVRACISRLAFCKSW